MSDALPDLAALQAELTALLRVRLPELPEGGAPGTNLYEAGLDSMGIMQLLLAIEDRFGILLPEADVSRRNFCNVENLAGLLRDRLANTPGHER
jgi:acyl carrier protein